MFMKCFVYRTTVVVLFLFCCVFSLQARHKEEHPIQYVDSPHWRVYCHENPLNNIAFRIEYSPITLSMSLFNAIGSPSYAYSEEDSVYGKSFSIRVEGTYSVPAPETDITHVFPYFGNGYVEGFWEYSFGYTSYYDDNDKLVCRRKKEISQRHLDVSPCTDHTFGGQ